MAAKKKAMLGEYIAHKPLTELMDIDAVGGAIPDAQLMEIVRHMAATAATIKDTAAHFHLSILNLWCALASARGRSFYNLLRELRSETDVARVEEIDSLLADVTYEMLNPDSLLHHDRARVAVAALGRSAELRQWMAERRAPRNWGPRQIIQGDEHAPLTVLLRPGDDRF